MCPICRYNVSPLKLDNIRYASSLSHGFSKICVCTTTGPNTEIQFTGHKSHAQRTCTYVVVSVRHFEITPMCFKYSNHLAILECMFCKRAVMTQCSKFKWTTYSYGWYLAYMLLLAAYLLRVSTIVVHTSSGKKRTNYIKFNNSVGRNNQISSLAKSSLYKSTLNKLSPYVPNIHILWNVTIWEKNEYSWVLQCPTEAYVNHTNLVAKTNNPIQTTLTSKVLEATSMALWVAVSLA